MRNPKLVNLCAAAGLLALGACSESTSPSASLVNQATITSDVASSAGDAISTDVTAMVLNETAAGLAPGMPAPNAVAGDSFTYTRTRTCFDSTGGSITCGTAGVRKIATHVSFAGFVSDTSEDGAAFSKSVTRVAFDTLFRNFTGATETSRTHDGNSAGSDTSSFVGPNVTRTYDESGTDSVDAVTWNLPRFNNPFPVSGKIIRNVSVHATFKSATRSDTTDVTRRVEVDFPPDSQGNVVLKINGKTCNLNLVTHRVSNCR